jgi:hypothetical protein
MAARADRRTKFEESRTTHPHLLSESGVVGMLGVSEIVRQREQLRPEAAPAA